LRATPLLVVLVLVALLCGGAGAGRRSPPLATDLGTLGGDWSVAFDINDSGQVVGGAENSDEWFHAFLWSRGKMTDLGTLPGIPSGDEDEYFAYGVNNRGQVVGVCECSGIPPEGADRAFLWSQGAMTDLGSLGGTDNSAATDINDAGQVVGYSYSYTTTRAVGHAFLWSNGTMTDLGTLGGSVSQATAINKSGQVVGWSQIAGDRVSHAFLWSAGKMTDLGTRRGRGCSYASAINDRGQVVGWSGSCPVIRGKRGPYRAVLWSRGKIRNLGTLGNRSSEATGINERGQVVGDTYTPKRVPDHAFLWSRGRMSDLGSLYGTLCCIDSYAHGVNDSGQVVGDSWILDRHIWRYHAILWREGNGVTLCYRKQTVQVTKQIAERLRKRGAKPGACRKPKH
jgi:probable HAF family extracellular repeat protein